MSILKVGVFFFFFGAKVGVETLEIILWAGPKMLFRSFEPKKLMDLMRAWESLGQPLEVILKVC